MSLDQILRCEYCNKSTLSLLLLRPSPIARAAPLEIPGSDSVADAGAHAAGLLPARSPTESRSVLRLLRAGFVHVYIPNPPPPLRQWHVYQVTDNADLVPHTMPAFNPAKAPGVCSRDVHNAAGMRLLTLPHAHKLGTIWIAYSPNLWSDKVKASNAANPRAMQAVNLLGGSANTFKPTAQALSTHVLECAIHKLQIDGSTSIDFPFCTMAGEKAVASLARNLEQAAAGHPLTAGKELAVVLRDPSGYARELNHLRVRRHEHATRVTMNGPEAHPLTSIAMLDGLRKSIVDDVAMKAYDAVAPVTSAGAFGDVMRIKPNPRGWPEGTRWEPLSGSPENIARYGRGMGRVILPDHAERASRWQIQQTKATYDRYRTQVHESRLGGWLLDFEARFKAAHTDPLERLESDWWAAAQDDLLRDVWALHFDPHDPNDPLEAWSPGAAFTAEVAAVFAPQPYVRGTALDEYVEQLRKAVRDPWAVMLRALAANQESLFSVVSQYIADTRPDKLHDLASGLVVKGRELIESGKPGPHRAVYSWMLHGGYAAGTLGITHAMSGALAATLQVSGSSVSGALASGALAPKALEAVDRMRAWLMTSKAITLAQQSVKTASALRVPMWVEFDLSVREALGLAQLADVRPHEIHRGASQGRVKIALAVDHHEVQQRYGGNARAALEAGAGQARLGEVPAALLLAKGAMVLDASHARAMLAVSATQVDKATAAVQEIMATGRGGFVSLDGHIGMVTVLLNGWGFVKTVKTERWHEDSLARANFLDAVFSMTAGCALMAEAAMAANITHRLGKDAAKSAASVVGARAVAAVFGTAGSLATTAGQFISAKRAQAAGDKGAAYSYYASTGAFAGLAASQSAIAAGAVAEFMISRGSKRAIWFATRRGVEGMGKWIAQRARFGLSGWGLVFLGFGLLFEVVATIVSPDALQKHLRRSYFGTGDAKGKYKTLAEELAGLEGKSDDDKEPAAIPAGMSDVAAP